MREKRRCLSFNCFSAFTRGGGIVQRFSIAADGKSLNADINPDIGSRLRQRLNMASLRRSEHMAALGSLPAMHYGNYVGSRSDAVRMLEYAATHDILPNVEVMPGTNPDTNSYVGSHQVPEISPRRSP